MDRPMNSAIRPKATPVHVHDLHATLLHLLGFDHTKLTYRYAGRDFRLTDLYGNIVPGLTVQPSRRALASVASQPKAPSASIERRPGAAV